MNRNGLQLLIFRTVYAFLYLLIFKGSPARLQWWMINNGVGNQTAEIRLLLIGVHPQRRITYALRISKS